MPMYKAYRTVAALTIAGALTSSLSFAQNAEDERRLQEIARTAAQNFAAARVEADQTRPTAPPPPAGAVVELSLDAATERALERNLDIAVERLNPQTFDFSLAALDANYRPTFTSNFGVRSQSTFTRSTTAGATNALGLVGTDTLTSNTGFTQNLKWGGGSFAAAWNNNRQEQS